MEHAFQENHMSVDNVIPLFNDRRLRPTDAPMVHPVPQTRAEYLEHLREHHHWGGPASATLGRLRDAHEARHTNDGLWFTESSRHAHP